MTDMAVEPVSDPVDVHVDCRSELERYRGFWNRSVEKLNSVREELKDFLINALQAGSIDVDIAQEIAKIADIDLTREVTYTATIRVTFTRDVRFGEDPDITYDLGEYIEVTPSYGDADIIDWDVVRVSFEEHN